MSSFCLQLLQTGLLKLKKAGVYCLAKMSYAWSAMIIALALGADAFMHTFNVPHMEGWWIPVVSGTSAYAGLRALFHRKHPK